MTTLILIAATLFVGLMAGLFYAWSISVTPGLAMTEAEPYLRAFQAMNRAILQPLFFVAFFGALILLPLLAVLYYHAALPAQFWCVLAATVLYALGIMLVTILGNIPLNNSLDALDVNAMTQEQMAAFRSGFEDKWNRLNTIRTVSSALSFLFLLIACLQYNNN